MTDLIGHRLGDFEIVRELGRGGMGIVFEARQISLNRRVALKVLSSGLGLTSKAVLRLQREAEAAAKLHHTNIVPVYAAGEENGTYFYAMELIDGPSLDHVIRQLCGRGITRSGRRTEAGPAGNPTGKRWTEPALLPFATPSAGTQGSRPGSQSSGSPKGSCLSTARWGLFQKLFDYVAGELAESNLLRAAKSSQKNAGLAHYFIGLSRLAEADRGGARERFQKAVNTSYPNIFSQSLSVVFLKRLEKDPTWPPWIPMMK